MNAILCATVCVSMHTCTCVCVCVFVCGGLFIMAAEILIAKLSCGKSSAKMNEEMSKITSGMCDLHSFTGKSL